MYFYGGFWFWLVFGIFYLTWLMLKWSLILMWKALPYIVLAIIGTVFLLVALGTIVVGSFTKKGRKAIREGHVWRDFGRLFITISESFLAISNPEASQTRTDARAQRNAQEAHFNQLVAEICPLLEKTPVSDTRATELVNRLHKLEDRGATWDEINAAAQRLLFHLTPKPQAYYSNRR